MGGLELGGVVTKLGRRLSGEEERWKPVTVIYMENYGYKTIAESPENSQKEPKIFRIPKLKF